MSPSQAAANQAPKNIAKPVLLVVDDEEGPRQSLKAVFKKDYEVLLANSGEAALEIAQKHPIEVVVCDIMMTGMSGTELLRRLKDLRPTVEVIMLTAYETIETARQAIRYGACDYLNKPFDIHAIRTAVARALDKHRASTGLHNTVAKLQQLQQELGDQKVLSELTRTKGEIYASVLHDINSPLTVICGFIDSITRSIGDTSNVDGEKLEEIKGDLSILTGQVHRCFEISRRYLSFLHGNASIAGSVSANQVFRDVKELLLRHPSARGHQLVIHQLPEDVTAEINGTDFLQVLLNLTLNALQCDAAPHCVEMSVRPMGEPFDLAAVREGSAQRFINRDGFVNNAPLLAITIEDNGPGMNAEQMAKIFEERFSTKEVGQGTGLGLSIVRRLVSEAKGGLHVRTKPGEGTAFTILVRTKR